jgi:hypothetical protein
MFWKSNNAAVVNRLDSLHGLIGANNEAVSELIADKLIKVLAPKAELEISEQFDLASPAMVREISNNINKRLTDAIDSVKAQSTGHLGATVSAIYKTSHVVQSKLKDIDMRMAVIEGTALTTQTTASKLTHSLDDALDQSNQNFEEMGRTLSLFDAANGDRMLTLFNKLRELEHQMGHRHQMTHAKLAAQYASLSAQINDLRPKDRKQYRVNPSVEWFIDNLDEIMRIAEVAELVRNNHIPRDKAAYELTKAIRQVHPYAIDNLLNEVASKIESWDKLQDFRQAA